MNNPRETYQRTTEELKAMYEEDQAMRHRYLKDRDSQEWDETIDHRNTERLKEIIDEIGWPSISKVGKEGSWHAWLIVQHADRDLQFQKKCLSLMKLETEGEIDKADLAFLEDRIAVGDGMSQVYGTQFYKDQSGKMIPRPIIDPENLKQRRLEMGITESFEEYQAGMQKYNQKNA